MRNPANTSNLVWMPDLPRPAKTVCALTAALLCLGLASGPAMAANGGTGPDEVTTPRPKPKPKPKPKIKVDPESGGGAMPGQTTPKKPPKPKKPTRKPTKKPTKAPAKKPAKKPVRKPVKKPAKKPAKKPQGTPTTPVSPSGIFPVRGDHDFGGTDSRFGAQRTGHIHQGQDVAAAEGTPVVAPIAATILYRGNQPDGAGNYLVLHGRDGRDYVFMHLKDASIRVNTDDSVSRGERIAQVGNTGHSSGPHLHFEIWVGGWQSGGHPIDPLPYLKSWDRTS